MRCGCVVLLFAWSVVSTTVRPQMALPAIGSTSRFSHTPRVALGAIMTDRPGERESRATSFRRVGGRIPTEPQRSPPRENDPWPVTQIVAAAVLLICLRSLVFGGGSDTGVYYYSSSFSSTSTTFMEDGKPKTETRTERQTRTNVPGLLGAGEADGANANRVQQLFPWP